MSNSTREYLKSFGLTHNFIGGWFKPFNSSYENLTEISCENIIELFRVITVALPKPADYIKKRQMFLKYIGGKWFIDKHESKPHIIEVQD